VFVYAVKAAELKNVETLFAAIIVKATDIYENC
jgi:hypothetical protein